MAQTDYNDKSLDGVLGTQTQGGRMVGAEESAELWRHPIFLNEIGSLSFYKTCHWYVARSPYCERAPSSESQNGYVLDVSKSQRGGGVQVMGCIKIAESPPRCQTSILSPKTSREGLAAAASK